MKIPTFAIAPVDEKAVLSIRAIVSYLYNARAILNVRNIRRILSTAKLSAPGARDAYDVMTISMSSLFDGTLR